MVEPQLIEDHGLIGCPHCGSEPTVTRRPAHKHTGPLAGFMPPVGESVTVECIRCGAGMIGPQDGGAEAVAATLRGERYLPTA